MLKTLNKLSSSQQIYLNFLRGISAIVVLCGHTFPAIPGEFTFGKTLPFQSLAVGVFFWLSGFLIAYHCLTKQDYSFKNYILDRFCRIYVIYIPVVACSVVLMIKVHLIRIPTNADILANLFMLQHTPFDRIFDNLSRFPPLAGISPLWSIAVEWWLYVFFGIVFFFHKSSSSSKLLMAVLSVPAVLVVSYFALREYVALTWFLGAACAYHFCNLSPNYYNKRIDLLIFVSLAAFLYRLNYLNNTVMNMYDMQMVIPGCIFLYSALLRLSTYTFHFSFKVLSTSLGFISYSLYLSHEPMKQVLQLYIPLDSWRNGIMVAMICILIASICAYFLENKHLIVRRWLKDKLFSDETPKIPLYSPAN